MGREACRKAFQNTQRSVAATRPPPIGWQTAERVSGRTSTDPTLITFLQSKGFDESEAQTAARLVQYHSFKSGQTLVHPGQNWPFVMFVIAGKLQVGL